MPKIYQYFGILFSFFSNDHSPVHVHVKYGEYENKLEFVYKNGKLVAILAKRVGNKKSLPSTLLTDSKKFMMVYESSINKKWFDFYGKNIKPKFEKVTKKIK